MQFINKKIDIFSTVCSSSYSYILPTRLVFQHIHLNIALHAGHAVSMYYETEKDWIFNPVSITTLCLSSHPLVLVQWCSHAILWYYPNSNYIWKRLRANIGYFKKFWQKLFDKFCNFGQGLFGQRHIASQYMVFIKYSNYASCVPSSYSYISSPERRVSRLS